MSNSTILMKLGMGDYTAALRAWVTKQITNSSTKIGGLYYNPDDNMLHVIGESKEDKIGKGIDMKQFIALGMLSDVLPGEKNGQFTFIFKTTDPETGEETTKNYEVDFGELVNSYPVDDVSIEINDKGEIAVKNVDAMKTMLEEDIRVLGGPLSNNTTNWPWTDDSGAKILPKKTSIGKILEGLFYSVVSGTVSKPSVTWIPSFVKNPITISTPNLTSTTVEVGTKAKFKVSQDYTLQNNTRTLKFVCSQGYFLSTGTNAEGKLEFGQHNTGNYTQSETGGTQNQQKSISWRGVNVTNHVDNYTEYTIEEGSSNTFSVTQSITATAPLFDDITVYGADNVKKAVPEVNESYKESDTDKANGIVTKLVKLENPVTYTITGARAYWMGSLSEVNKLSNINENTIISSGLTKGVGSLPATLKITQGSMQVVIATTKEITKITSENQQGNPVQTEFDHYDDVYIAGANGYTKARYHVYVWNAVKSFNADTLNITYK